MKSEIDLYFRKILEGATWFHDQFVNCPVFKISLREIKYIFEHIYVASRIVCLY